MWECDCRNHATPQSVFERHLDSVFRVRTFGAVPFPIWPEPRRGPVAAFARQTFSLIRTEEQRGKRDRRRPRGCINGPKRSPSLRPIHGHLQVLGLYVRLHEGLLPSALVCSKPQGWDGAPETGNGTQTTNLTMCKLWHL